MNESHVPPPPNAGLSADDPYLLTVRPIFDGYSDATDTIGDCDLMSGGHATCRAYARGATQAEVDNLLVRPPFSMTAYDAAQVDQVAHDACCPNVTAN